ncbi:hypothetical protein [Nostoc sp. MG11]|uniref:hypothetical protein n=1 Tax=Nostoc sp. MG11 TaxID=2721166 RepID=UPI0018673575|nr:hypothetical protein [Nostoc sp. MG11]
MQQSSNIVFTKSLDGIIYVCDAIAVTKKPLGTPEVMVPDLVSTCDYNLSLAISR